MSAQYVNEQERVSSANTSLPPSGQTHIHEFLGSTKISGPIPHNHRFAGVSSQEIPIRQSHVHAISGNTDFVFGHLHEIGLVTGPAVFDDFGRHVHFAYGETTENLGHNHAFIFATLIEAPFGPAGD